jgi:hypothetical protein
MYVDNSRLITQQRDGFQHSEDLLGRSLRVAPAMAQLAVAMHPPHEPVISRF